MLFLMNKYSLSLYIYIYTQSKGTTNNAAPSILIFDSSSTLLKAKLIIFSVGGGNKKVVDRGHQSLVVKPFLFPYTISIKSLLKGHWFTTKCVLSHALPLNNLAYICTYKWYLSILKLKFHVLLSHVFKKITNAKIIYGKSGLLRTPEQGTMNS